MATKTRSRRSKPRTAVIKIGKRRRRSVGAVGSSIGKTHHRRRRAVGSIGKTRKRRKRVSGTKFSSGKLKQIGMMALGVATGATITHVIMRPLEAKLIEKYPMVAKFIAAGEVVVGGMIAIASKKDFVKSVGIGILAGGVHGIIKQVDLYKHIPGIHGPEEYQTIHVPISGDVERMVSGLLKNNRETYTNNIAGDRYTDKIAGHRKTDYTNQVAGEWDDVWEMPDAKS